MNKNISVALVTCYFGKLPFYLTYFIYSCKFNSTIDFYIITDDVSFIEDLPSNVKLIYKTIDEVTLLAKKKLGFSVNISYGYKMCDFKPAYGVIFSDILKGYEFWGHCDIDLIFGNIRNFITDELLNNYDLISVRHDWLSGCFLLYKNIPKMNQLFMSSKDYKKVFTSNQHYCFDETNFAHDAFSDGKSYLDIHTEVESMMHVVKKKEAGNYIKPFFDFFIIEGLPGKLKWENGHMYYKNKYEILFYHLIYFKKLSFPKKMIRSNPSCFTISPTKIYNQSKSKSISNEF